MDNKFILLNTSPHLPENPTNVEFFAKLYFKRCAETLCVQHDNLEIINITTKYLETWDSGHPNRDDTMLMLKELA